MPEGGKPMRQGAKIAQARRLRQSMTKPEIWLWDGLRRQHKTGPVFRRQHAIGPYILDFYCVKARLAVEVDGVHHTYEPQRARDMAKDAFMADLGIVTHRVMARDLLMAPDETITGVIDLAIQRLAELGIPLPSFAAQTPPSP
jgi:very-short-patch-repair endonuclease